jgi:hypothetical protein
MEAMRHAFGPLVGTGTAALAFLSFVNTMPDNPPASLREIPGWCYRWGHDFLKTFVSFQGPKKGGQA